MIRREQDWRSRLLRWSQTQLGKPFVWGQTDCGSLGRFALIEMFGDEIMLQIPTSWDSAFGAARALQECGSIGGILEELGAERTTVPFMRTGDIVVSAEPEEEIGRQSVLVCIDGRRCLASTRNGVVMSDPTPESTVYSLWEVKV